MALLRVDSDALPSSPWRGLGAVVRLLTSPWRRGPNDLVDEDGRAVDEDGRPLSWP